jgi:hypothetical protein
LHTSDTLHHPVRVHPPVPLSLQPSVNAAFKNGSAAETPTRRSDPQDRLWII